MDTSQTPSLKLLSQHQLGWWLIVFLSLFAFRVIIQLQALQGPIEHFPEFDAWHSAILPYPLLFGCQALILISACVLTWRMFTMSVVRKLKLGKVLYILGWVYWSVMLIRLLLGLTLLQDIQWFSQLLPALFHLLLANMLMLVGQYHRQARYDDGESR